MELTQDQLRKVLYYNRATGDSHRRFGTKNRKPWRRAGTRTGAGYEVIRVGGKLHYEHRLAVLYTTGSPGKPEKPRLQAWEDVNTSCAHRPQERQPSTQRGR